MVNLSHLSDAELDSMIAQSTPKGADGIDGVLARTGRAAVGGLSGMVGMVADPLQMATNKVAEMITGEKPAYVPFRTAAVKGYDVITGDAGLPRNQLERIVQGGGEALAGGAALGGIPKMAMTSVTDMVSQVGAGAAAQWAAENSDNPLAPLVMSVIGAMAPQVAQSVAKGAVPTIAKSFGINPKKVAQVERAGMPLNVPAVSDSPMIKRAANQMAELPGGKALKKSMDDAFNAAEKSIKSFGYTGTTTPTTAGETVSKAFTRWKADSLAKFKGVDDALQAAVPDDAPVITNGKGKSIAESIINITEEKGLTPRQIAERANHPAVREMQSLVDDAARNGGQLTLGALKEARTKIGNLPAPNPLMPSKKDALTDRAYGQLTKLMEDAYEQVGGREAKAAFTKRNILYKNYADEQTAYLGKLQKKLGESPETIFNTLTTGERIGATKAGKILTKLNPDELETVRDALIYQKGGAENFNIGTWANAYGKMSQEAKAALFRNDKTALKAHDDLIQAVNNYKDVGKFANFSGTTPSAINLIVKLTAGGGAGGAVLGLLTGAISIPTLIASAAISASSAYAINKALSGMMASPKYTKLLSKALTDTATNPQKYEKALIRAFADFGVNNDDLQKIQEVPQQQGITPSGLESLSDEELDRLIEQQQQPFIPATIQDTSSNFTQQQEGLRLSAYMDTTGNPTIGYGNNLNSPVTKQAWKTAGIQTPFSDAAKGTAAITPEEAANLHMASQQIAFNDAADLFPTLAKMPEGRQAALIDLSYQLGKPRLAKFGGMISAINKGDYVSAVKHLKNSDLWKQTPERAKRVARMILTGKAVTA